MIKGIIMFYDWVFQSPWRVILVIAAYIVVSALIVAIVRFFKWLFS